MCNLLIHSGQVLMGYRFFDKHPGERHDTAGTLATGDKFCVPMHYF